MWQRIQTLYLAISTGLLVSLIFSNVASVIGTDGQTAGIAFIDKIPYLSLLAVAILATFAALVTFARRGFQLRAAVIGALVLLGLQIWIVVDYFCAEAGIVFRFNAVFPIICVILNLLAARGIYSDELMVRNASRLRSAKRRK